MLKLRSNDRLFYLNHVRGIFIFMSTLRLTAFCVGAMVFISGCSYLDDSLWPTLTGEDPAREERVLMKSETAESEKATEDVMPSVVLDEQPQSKVSGSWAKYPLVGPTLPVLQTTGTVVGEKVADIQSGLLELQGNVRKSISTIQQIHGYKSAASQRYFNIVAVLKAKLQAGTTPGNPVLEQQLIKAQTELHYIDSVAPALTRLLDKFSDDVDVAGYLLDAVRKTYGMNGAVDTDHIQLRVLEDSLKNIVVFIEHVLAELSADVNRQTLYMENEKSNVSALSVAVSNGELYVTSFSGRVPTKDSSVENYSTNSKSDRPLVAIRFDRENVAYNQAVYNAVNKALEIKPDATFELVAVSPLSDTAAQIESNRVEVMRHAEAIALSLAEMGLPPNRIKLSAMTKEDAQSVEVYIYVR